MPRLVRLWYHTPFLDRWAYEWMWMRGGWDVEPWLPPDEPPDGGVREPRRPLPPEDTMQTEIDS